MNLNFSSMFLLWGKIHTSPLHPPLIAEEPISASRQSHAFLGAAADAPHVLGGVRGHGRPGADRVRRGSGRRAAAADGAGLRAGGGRPAARAGRAHQPGRDGGDDGRRPLLGVQRPGARRSAVHGRRRRRWSAARPLAQRCHLTRRHDVGAGADAPAGLRHRGRPRVRAAAHRVRGLGRESTRRPGIRPHRRRLRHRCLPLLCDSFDRFRHESCSFLWHCTSRRTVGPPLDLLGRSSPRGCGSGSAVPTRTSTTWSRSRKSSTIQITNYDALEGKGNYH